jgi:hypothetical protein
MDNGAYEKYKQENPDVYTPLSTYNYIELFVHEMTVTEMVICGLAGVLVVYAIYKLFFQRKDKHTDDPDA